MMNTRQRCVGIGVVAACVLVALAASAEWLGDYAEDATLNYRFTTRNLTPVGTTLAGSPVVAVYKGNETDTEKYSDAESYITLSVDFDGITGSNNILIDLSGDAFFATGEDYHIEITTGTVDSVSVVGETIATFSIENRFMRGTDSASTHSAADVWSAGSRALSTPADYKATGFSTHAAADVWTAGSRELSTPASYKATGFSTHSAADVWTTGSRELSTPASYKATGFSTHAAADVWTASTRALSTPGDYKADVSALATTSALSTHDGKLDTAQTDLDTLTGSDGATLATAQGLYEPAKAGDAMTLAADAVSAAALKADAVTEIQSGLATTGADSDTLETLSDQLDAVANAGSGDTEVNHNTGGADVLAYSYGGAGIDNATITAYLTSEYDAGTLTPRGSATTDSAGQWVNPMMLNSGLTYTLVYYKSGSYGPDTKEVTVP